MPPDFRKKIADKRARGEAAPMGGAPEQTGLAIRQTARYELAERIELPPEAADLSPEVQEIARHYINARQRIGAALLEAAQWLAEARERTEHGGWETFLQVTQTSPDTAERLRLIHERANEHPAFRDAVVRGWFTESAAWRLARPSAPINAIDRLLDAPTPPTVKHVEATIKAMRATFQRDSHAPAEPADVQIPPRGGIWDDLSDSTDGANGTIILSLDADEQAMVAHLTRVIRGYVDHPETLSDADWHALLPLAQVLIQLLHQRPGSH